MFCRFCGKELPDDSLFCPSCGREQGLKYKNPDTKEKKVRISVRALLIMIAMYVTVVVTICALIVMYNANNRNSWNNPREITSDTNDNSKHFDTDHVQLNNSKSDEALGAYEETEEEQKSTNEQVGENNDIVYRSSIRIKGVEDSKAYLRFVESETMNRERDKQYDGEKVYEGVSDKSIISRTVPEGTTVIGDGAFEGCKNLEEVVLPDTVKIIGEKAFYGCESLRTINLPDDTEIIGNMAFSNSGLEEIVLPHKLRVIGDSAFVGTKIKSIIIPENVERLGYHSDDVSGVRGGVFGGCSELERVEFLTNKISFINIYTFSGCESLSSIDIPEGVVAIEGYAFLLCESLSDVKLPNSLEEIGESAFKYDISLSQIVLPPKVEVVSGNAFYNCNNLEITLPDSLSTVFNGSFGNCKTVTVPISALENIGISKELFESEPAEGSRVVYIK